MTTVRKVQVGDIEIAYDTFGDQGAVPLVLVMGLGAQLIAWPDDFTAALAERGHYVIRYDNRDSGESTHFADREPDVMAALGGDYSSAAYTMADLADDGAGLLDALDLDSAHWVGASMGGMIVQEIAIRHPDRVRSLTSIMSTPSASVEDPTEEARASLLAPPAANRAELVERAPQMWRVIGSPGFEQDDEWIRDVAGRQYDRGYDPAGVMRQLLAIVSAPDRRAGLATVSVPTLVVHGEADPLVPISGGRATAEAVPGARLLTYPGMGHDLPRALWPEIIDAISDVVAQGEDERVRRSA